MGNDYGYSYGWDWGQYDVKGRVRLGIGIEQTTLAPLLNSLGRHVYMLLFSSGDALKELELWVSWPVATATRRPY